MVSSVPFVDLQPIHEPLQKRFEAAFQRLLSQGDFVLGEALTHFEQAFAAACGVEHCAGVACGTDAIALGLQACGIGPGTSILLPANTFVATLIGVLRTGAVPILVDCDPATGLIDLNAAADCVRSDTQAILPVHLYGQMVSPSALLDFAAAHDLIIFEDAAQAHLAEREGYRAGSIGMAAAFSFYPSKNLGALGDGGAVVTKEASVAKRMQSLRNYGAPRKYFHTEFGTNSRLDTLQADILNIKLPHLSDWNRDRNRLGQRYDEALSPLKPQLRSLENQSGSGHVYHLYITRLNPEMERNALQQALAEQGIQTGVHYPLPCHLQPAFRDLGYDLGDFPHAERLCQTILSLPMYPGLQAAQQDRVIEVLKTTIDSSLNSRTLAGIA